MTTSKEVGSRMCTFSSVEQGDVPVPAGGPVAHDVLDQLAAGDDAHRFDLSSFMFEFE